MWFYSQILSTSETVTKAHQNGIVDVALVDQGVLRNRKPGLAVHALGAVEVPREFVIDPWSAPLAYLTQAAPAKVSFWSTTKAQLV